MSWIIILAAVWVLAATVVAMLPMRRQYVPGSILMLLAPVLIGAFGYQYGWIAGLGALAAFVSMFRNPLIYFARKWTGRDVSGFGPDRMDS